MTPKIKAEDLYHKFLTCQPEVWMAKQIALICVDELLYFADTQADGDQERWVEYFNEVKKEIEKL